MWKKPEGCESNQCVEVEFLAGDTGFPVWVRDGKRGSESPQLGFTGEEWDNFIIAVKAGQYDRETV